MAVGGARSTGVARQKTSALESFSGCEAVTLDLALWGSLRAPWAHGVLPCLSLSVGDMLVAATVMCLIHPRFVRLRDLASLHGKVLVDLGEGCKGGVEGG